jgi:hypothetical protein
LVSYIDEQWECDIVDMQHLSRQNKGFKYIITIIDCFSKFLFAYPVKSKKSLEIISVFNKIFRYRKPVKLRSDRGLEFDNKIFTMFCKKNDVTFFTSQDKQIKCAIVERVNRTLKAKMYRYFTHRGTQRYIDILQKLIDSYNSSYHRSIKMRPIDVNKSNESLVFQNLYNAKSFKDIFYKEKMKNNSFKIGDTVRLKYDLNEQFDKSYYPLWTDQIFEVDNVINRKDKLLYTLKMGGEKLARRFYPEELQKVKVDNDTIYRVEKIVKRRTVNGRKEVFVKWLNYPPSFNQWIPERNIQNLQKGGSMNALLPHLMRFYFSFK